MLGLFVCLFSQYNTAALGTMNRERLQGKTRSVRHSAPCPVWPIEGSFNFPNQNEINCISPGGKRPWDTPPAEPWDCFPGTCGDTIAFGTARHPTKPRKTPVLLSG